MSAMQANGSPIKAVQYFSKSYTASEVSLFNIVELFHRSTIVPTTSTNICDDWKRIAFEKYVLLSESYLPYRLTNGKAL